MQFAILSAMPHVSELVTWPNLVLGVLLGGFVLWATMSAVAANQRRGYQDPASF